MLETILSEYRLALAELESTAAIMQDNESGHLTSDALSRVKQVLLDREKQEEVRNQNEMNTESSSMAASLAAEAQDPQLSVLRTELIGSIRRESDILEGQMGSLQARL